MINRRTMIKATAGVGTLAGVGGLVRYQLLAPPASANLESADALAREVFDALPEDAKARACLPFEHPLRQFHNRGLWLGGVNASGLQLSWRARRALTDLVYAGLSNAGRTRIPKQDALRWTGVNSTQLLFFGNPYSGPYQVVLSGVHVNLRLGGRTPEGLALGGVQVYGDQRGNGEVGLPGNVYRFQMLAAQRLVEALTPAERRAVRVALAPAQTNVGVQGSNGRFDGLAIGELSASRRGLARDLVAGILGTYADADAAYAWKCLEYNGGIDALHFADYEVDPQGGRRAGDAPSQIFRLEGPAAVMHFRGEPHVHAFINVAMDGEQPLSLGEQLGQNPQVLEGEALRVFFETGMAEQGEADVASYTSVIAGRLRAGTVRTGDIWLAESWGDDLVVVEVRGADLAQEIITRLRARGVEPQSRSTYRIATLGNTVRSGAKDRLGTIGAERSLGLLRESISANLRKRGFNPSPVRPV